MTAIGVLGNPLPASGSWLTTKPFIELCAAIVLLELASTYLGLLISTLVSSSDLAMQVLILPVMIQIVFCGGFFTLTGVANLVSTLIPARWGFAAVSSTAQLNELNRAMGIRIDPWWDHTAGAWLLDTGMMLAWSVAYVLLAWWQLTGSRPGRRTRRKAAVRSVTARVEGASRLSPVQ